MLTRANQNKKPEGRSHNITCLLTFVQVGVSEAAAQLLDNMDGLKVPGSLQPHDSVDSQPSEVIFVMSQQFGRQSGAGDVQQVLLETCRVVATT